MHACMHICTAILQYQKHQLITSNFGHQLQFLITSNIRKILVQGKLVSRPISLEDTHKEDLCIQVYQNGHVWDSDARVLILCLQQTCDAAHAFPHKNLSQDRRSSIPCYKEYYRSLLSLSSCNEELRNVWDNTTNCDN